MAYSTCKIKNISGGQLIIRGQTYQSDEAFPINDVDRVAHASDDDICGYIVANDIAIHDSEGAIVGHAAQIAHLQDY